MNILVKLIEQKGAYILKPSKHACERQAKSGGYVGETRKIVEFLMEGQIYQVDYDFVALARMLGKPVRKGREGRRNGCLHYGTDGTVKCPACGKPVGEFIAEARDWLDRREGCCFRVPSKILGWED